MSARIVLLLAALLGVGAVQAQNNAQYVSQSVPNPMTPGQTYTVTVTMKNTGGSTWTRATNFLLGSQNPQDNLTWGTNRIPLAEGVSVSPGQNGAYNLQVTAPSTPGIYNFQWKMLEELVEWFGELSENVEVAVGPVDHAQYVSHSVPTSMNASQTYAVVVTMKNTGGTTWNPGDYYLRSQDPQDNANFGIARAELASPVAPGANAVFNFNVTPPASGISGNLIFRWRMAHNTASFGGLTPNVGVSVSGTNNSQFVSHSAPAVMTAGQMYPVDVRFKNTGTNTWTNPGYFRIGSQNPLDNFTWGTNRAELPTAAFVPPNADATYTVNVTAPSTPGTYNFQWQTLRELVEWFGAVSTNAVVVVGTPNAAFVSQSVPGTMLPGVPNAVSVTMTNTGNLTWQPGQHHLRSQNPSGNTNFGINKVELAAAVPPGQSATFNFDAVPAVASGTLNFQWRMADGKANGNPTFGDATPNIPVGIGAPVDAQFVSQIVPSTMVPGQPQLMRVVMRNNGGTAWTSAAGFQLASQNPADNTTWGLDRVPLPHDVPPGASVVFVFNATAPSTTATYNFQWKMVHGSIPFGASSTNVAINVQPSVGEVVSYIHVDHLNTPRAIYDASQQLRWKWEQREPFGVSVPDENPSLLGVFEFALRFPGQYADKDTNTTYNYFRDYDPATGRYIQSDPIGLKSGLNTYSYVDGSPTKLIDLLGLEPGDMRQRGYPDPNPSSSPVNACRPDPEREPGLEGVFPECSLPGLRIFCGIAGIGGSISVKGKGGKGGKDGTPGNNQAQNKQARDAANEAGGLTKDQQRQLHDAISGQNMDYHDIVEIAKDIKSGKY